MKKYIINRLLLFIPTLLGISMAIFFLIRVLPGDVAEVLLRGPSGDATFTQEDLDRLRESLGLNRPIYVQYADWVWDVARGDLGYSLARNGPIADELKRQFPVSVQLGVITI